MPDWKPRNTARARELRSQATPAERKLWRYLGAGRLDGHRFSRQMPLGPYFADFPCRRSKLIVELDGYSHDLSQDRDAAQDRYLEEAGYQVLRLANDDVKANVEGGVRAIEIALEGRPTPSPSRKREGRR